MSSVGIMQLCFDFEICYAFLQKVLKWRLFPNLHLKFVYILTEFVHLYQTLGAKELKAFQHVTVDASFTHILHVQNYP